MEESSERQVESYPENPGDLPGAIDDPVMVLLFQGQAETLHEAEELYINASLPEVVRLAASDLTNEQLAEHPLIQLLVAHGSRGWEDSLL
jgi:hypothetical protein